MESGPAESGARRVLGFRGHGGGGKTGTGNRKARRDLVPSAEPTTFLCFVEFRSCIPSKSCPVTNTTAPESGKRKAFARSSRHLECDGASMRNVDRRDGKVALTPLSPCCKTAEACGEAAMAS